MKKTKQKNTFGTAHVKKIVIYVHKFIAIFHLNQANSGLFRVQTTMIYLTPLQIDIVNDNSNDKMCLYPPNSF